MRAMYYWGALVLLTFGACSSQPASRTSATGANLLAGAGAVEAADNDAGAEEERVASNSRGSDGLIEGTSVWLVPDTPNGLRPSSSWFSISGSPDGTIYAAACDHTTNAALYALRPRSNTLRLIGDARSASEAADNWLPDETAEKFHVRPLWYQDRVYVATADYSNQDDLHLERRGYHWYAYDERSREFTDLSASEPTGVAAEHISIFSTALDEPRGLIYGLGSPNGNLYQYNIATGTTVDLGRPPELTRKYYNPGRFLWVDEAGRVYWSLANAGMPAPEEMPTPKHVLSWDPQQGFVPKPDWTISEMLRTGQRSLDGKRVYILDYQLNLYLFDETDGSFKHLVKGELPAEHVSPRTMAIRVRSTQLSANEKKIYFVNDSALNNSLWEWEFASGAAPRELVRTTAIDPRLEPTYNAFTGHDSWDNRGRFMFSGFGGEGFPPTPHVYFIRVDPVRLKAGLGLLPGVAEVRLRGGQLVRSGDLTSALDVIMQAQAVQGAEGKPTQHHVAIAAGEAQVALPDELSASASRLSVIPDGDTYVVASGFF